MPGLIVKAPTALAGAFTKSNAQEDQKAGCHRGWSGPTGSVVTGVNRCQLDHRDFAAVFVESHLIHERANQE